jgi:aspartate ammonia-lyase
MDINEAISVVQAVKGRYQAFEKLEEVLIGVAQSQAIRNDNEIAVVQAKAKLDEIVKETLTAQTNFDEKKKEWEDSLLVLADGYADRHKELQDELGNYKEEVKRHIEELKGKLDSAITEYKVTTGNMDKRLSDQHAEVNSLVDEIRNLKTRIGAI